MLYIFKKIKWFTLLFFTILIIDILVKINLSSFPFRYASKPFIITLLMMYYYLNSKEKENKKCLFLSLIIFLIGDIIIIEHSSFISLAMGMLCFSFAKIFLSLRFSHKYDFNIIRLIPLSVVMFIYTILILSIVYKDLGAFFIPAIICFFLSLLLFQFAVLRRDVVDRTSYIFVLTGVLLYIISESMMAIKAFSNLLFPMHNILIMFFYGSALYFIVIGIVNEKKIITRGKGDITFS